jgi:hypothetical protein
MKFILLLYQWLYKPIAGPCFFFPPYTHARTHAQNKCTQTFMLRVGFDSTVSVFEGANTVHALDHTATVIVIVICTSYCSGSYPNHLFPIQMCLVM